MEAVAAAVISALLALVVSAVVQLVIVPRVDIRRRRNERWEATLIELGEKVLIKERGSLDAIDQAVQKLLHARETWQLTPAQKNEVYEYEYESGTPELAWHQGISDAHRLIDAAFAAHDREMVALGWLFTKLEADAPRGVGLKGMRRAYSTFCRTAVALQDARTIDGFGEYTPLSEAGWDGIYLEVIPIFDAHRAARDGVVREVKRLLISQQAGKRIQMSDPYQDARQEWGDRF
ncbi:hypothetical protein [Nocardioides ochotonae]|uniref:hypothetical protein n=1 Tax=Nocardioides ochotonae TaxID=2685869 RepID=UPI001FB790EC|nr:hypothetical protein [Nocardioides ochotonae]